MTDCDIVLAPSRDDPLPFVTLDALSLAKVLVCSRTTGTSAYLRSAESALILTQNSPEEIGETLSLAISDPGLRTKLGQRAREVYEREFTWKAFRAKLLSELEPGSRSRVSQLLVSAQASIRA